MFLYNNTELLHIKLLHIKSYGLKMRAASKHFIPISFSKNPGKLLNPMLFFHEGRWCSCQKQVTM